MTLGTVDDKSQQVHRQDASLVPAPVLITRLLWKDSSYIQEIKEKIVIILLSLFLN